MLVAGPGVSRTRCLCWPSRRLLQPSTELPDKRRPSGFLLLQYPRWPVASNPILGYTACYGARGLVDGSRLMVSFASGKYRSLDGNISRPDNCNGTYEAYCDPTREYTNITSIISESGRAGLLDYMKIYWKDYKGDDEDFWEHEWDKHGTCISTLEPKCYSNYASQQDVVDYFAKTVELFQDLNSYSVRKLIIHTTFTGFYSCDIIFNSIYLLPVLSQAKPGHTRLLQ